MRSASLGMADGSLVTALMRSPSITTVAFVHTLPLPSHNLPNLTALTFGVGFCCGEAAIPIHNTALAAARHRQVLMASLPSAAFASTAQRLFIAPGAKNQCGTSGEAFAVLSIGFGRPRNQGGGKVKPMAQARSAGCADRRWNCYCLLTIVFDGPSELEEATGGMGAATPAVVEPRPSCCRVLASSLPVGFKPCAS